MKKPLQFDLQGLFLLWKEWLELSVNANSQVAEELCTGSNFTRRPKVIIISDVPLVGNAKPVIHFKQERTGPEKIDVLRFIEVIGIQVEPGRVNNVLYEFLCKIC